MNKIKVYSMSNLQHNGKQNIPAYKKSSTKAKLNFADILNAETEKINGGKSYVSRK